MSGNRKFEVIAENRVKRVVVCKDEKALKRARRKLVRGDVVQECKSERVRCGDIRELEKSLLSRIPYWIFGAMAAGAGGAAIFNYFGA